MISYPSLSLSACLNGCLQRLFMSLSACLYVSLLACMPVYIYFSISLSVHNFIFHYECMKYRSACLVVLMSSYVYINIGLSVSRSLCICLSVRLSLSLSVHGCLPVCLSTFLSVCLYMLFFLSASLYIQKPVHCSLHFGLSISTFNSLSFCLSACLRPYVVSISCLFVCLHVSISVCMHVILHVCLSFDRTACLSGFLTV